MFSENRKGESEQPARRRRGRPPGPTPQSEERKEALYRTATRLFARDGYEATTMRAIAREAGVSPGLLYRYFPSKRAVVLRLYDELSGAFADRAAKLTGSGWRERFHRALLTSIETLAPHRDTLVALLPTLVADPEEGLFAGRTAFSRRRVQAVFERVVTDAEDAPHRDVVRALGRLLYVAHLGVLLLWFLDRTDDQKATYGAVGLLRGLLRPAAWALRVRRIRGMVVELDGHVGAALLAERDTQPG